MRYVFGTVCYLSVAGLLIALTQPKLYKKVLGGFAKQSRTIPFFIIVFALSLLAIKLIPEPAPKASTPKPETLSRVARAYQQQLKAAPTTGKVTYEIATKLTKNGLLPARITVVTPEKTAERLIIVNDEIIDRLKKDNLLDEKSKSFFIDYFDDKNTATTYFSTQANTKASLDNKQAAQLHYTAIYTYSSSTKSGQLFHFVTSKNIKTY